MKHTRYKYLMCFLLRFLDFTMNNKASQSSPLCKSIEIPGVTHGNVPIPAGALVGNILFSSGVAGKDPNTDQLPINFDQQVKFAFANAETLLKQAGAEWANVGRVTVYIRENSLRDMVNKYWLEIFPNAQFRPARHTKLYDLPFGMAIQLEFIAVLPQGRA